MEIEASFSNLRSVIRRMGFAKIFQLFSRTKQSYGESILFQIILLKVDTVCKNRNVKAL